MSNTAKEADNDQSNNVNITAIPPGNSHGPCNKATPSYKPLSNTAKATGNDHLTAFDVSAIIPGNGHGSHDKATSGNKFVCNTAREVKATVVASHDDSEEIVEARILSSDTETGKKDDGLAKEKRCAKNNFELEDSSPEYLPNSENEFEDISYENIQKVPYRELSQMVNRVSPGYKPPNRKLQKLQKVLFKSFNLIRPKEELQETRNLVPGNRQSVNSFEGMSVFFSGFSRYTRN